MENPVGRLRTFLERNLGCRPALAAALRRPRLIFDPCDFGDPWTKKTLLWGTFTVPEKRPVAPERVCSQGSWLMRLGVRDSFTPPEAAWRRSIVAHARTIQRQGLEGLAAW